jgi:hypothetical protein
VSAERRAELLREAAHAKHTAATNRAKVALRKLIKAARRSTSARSRTPPACRSTPLPHPPGPQVVDRGADESAKAATRAKGTYLAAHHAQLRGRHGELKAIGATRQRQDILVAYDNFTTSSATGCRSASSDPTAAPPLLARAPRPAAATPGRSARLQGHHRSQPRLTTESGPRRRGRETFCGFARGQSLEVSRPVQKEGSDATSLTESVRSPILL